MDPTKPNLVPENLLKKKHSLDLLKLRKEGKEEGRGNRKVSDDGKGFVLL